MMPVLRSNDAHKIALFMPTLSGGGIERNNLCVARELLRLGCSVDIVVANALGELRSSIPPGIRLEDMGIRLGQSRLLFAIRTLRRYLQESHPAILWSHSTEANLIAIAAYKLSRVSSWLIVSEHSTLSARTKKPPHKRVLPFLARRLYPIADRIHAVSEGVAADLTNITGIAREAIRVIYNPIVSEEIIEGSQATLEHPWFAHGQPPVILGAGRLTQEKDFPTLIRAFAIVREKRPAKLIILGEGKDRPKLEALTKELGLEQEVDIHGFVDNPYAFMSRAHVFVLSSKWEGFGNVLVEAMACGTPVVSTDCPHGPREILQDGKYGSLVPVGNAKMLAQAILECLDRSDETLRQRVRERAMDFRVSTIVQEYIHQLFPSAMLNLSSYIGGRL